MRAVDPTTSLMRDYAAAFRAADEELCRALMKLQPILERHDGSEAAPPREELYDDWVLSISVIREALGAVERIAALLALAAEDRLTD